MRAVRTWKSDGTTNRMRLQAAAWNLKRNAADDAVRGSPVDVIAALLDAGEEIETRLAVFFAEPGEAC